MSTYYALADCNNFYASCERAFNPKLAGRAIVVLSNNDGCVIARSNEAKALNIEMGTPYWKIKPLIRKHHVFVYSSNYQLYGDLSARVMDILQANCADVEVYSIDESFLKLCPFKDDVDTLLKNSLDLREKILRGVGLPISIGIAKTKTLAKLANHLAKKRTTNGVYFLTPNAAVLSELPISKVWGIARAYQRRLGKINVKTVADLIQVSEGWMQKEFGVVGLRLLKELKGIPCYDLDTPITARKTIMVSRSFRKDVYSLQELTEAIAVYATRLGEKLRRYHQVTARITVFLMANPFKKIKTSGRTYATRTVELSLATSCTNELISQAIQIVKALFEKNVNYKKAGILATHLRPANQIQGNLFVSDQKMKRNKALMQTIDQLNARMGRQTLFFGSCGIHKQQTWTRKAQWCSPKYTTRWEDILKVKI